MAITLDEQVARALDGVPLEAPAPEIAVRVVDLRIQAAAMRDALNKRYAETAAGLFLVENAVLQRPRIEANAALVVSWDPRRKHLATRQALRGTQRALTVARRQTQRMLRLAHIAIARAEQAERRLDQERENAALASLQAEEQLARAGRAEESLALVRAELETERMKGAR